MKHTDYIRAWLFMALAMTVISAFKCNAGERWRLDNSGGIIWTPASGESHSDHIEMAGKRVAVVLRYGVDASGTFSVNKSMVWPMLRTVPNNTHASLMRRYDWNPLDAVTVNGRSLTGEKTVAVSIREALNTESRFADRRYGSLTLRRCFFPSRELPALIERYTLVNTGNEPVSVEIPRNAFLSITDKAKGVAGAYAIEGRVEDSGAYTVAPGDSLKFAAFISAGTLDSPVDKPSFAAEYADRKAFVDSIMGSLVLETPDATVNRMMDFAKVRACESIFATKGGPMHGPGGESYYAAIWANDQAEYVNPLFPFIGYDYGNASALNSFRHFARFMNDDYKPIPSSIIAEGDDIWNGAGDRGDAAMIAYGAARYALARGDEAEARELWPLIEWCLEYCRRHLNKAGVVASDSDELEGRFPSGKANLCTSSLYYDALVSALRLLCALGEEWPYKKIEKYKEEIKRLRKNINAYFSANIAGFDTYAYYKGCDKLRSWICIPLTVGINERAAGTVDALFSPRLWSENGLLTQEGDSTFWDRSTLYALRGAYTVGATDKATQYLRQYSAKRLLGDHVPYAIEAWPEGSQRHLSAESGLYARIITEGLFGIRPIGLGDFSLSPRLPSDWDYMNLRHVKAFGRDFDIEVRRTGNNMLKLTLISGHKVQDFTVPPGKTIGFAGLLLSD